MAALTPVPEPLGAYPLSARAERRSGGEVAQAEGKVDGDEKQAGWKTAPELWQKLKPVARQMRRAPEAVGNRFATDSN